MKKPVVVMPDEVRDLATRYLAEVDTALPGFVAGLYVTGSTALGAWQAGPSDIDTIIVTSRSAGPQEMARLAAVHEAMPPKPHFDGIYLDSDTLRRQPMDRPVVPFVVDGRLRVDQPCGDLNPVVWLILIRYGLPVRGPAVTDLGLEIDLDALRRFNLDNLATYWAASAQQVRAALQGVPDDAPAEATEMTGYAVQWCVLGPPRLHYTLAHEDVISKAAAGTYLAENLPAYASLADRAVRWRQGETIAFTAADGRATADCIDAVIADALQRWGI